MVFEVGVAWIEPLFNFNRAFFIITNVEVFIFTLSEEVVHNLMIFEAWNVAHFDDLV